MLLLLRSKSRTIKQLLKITALPELCIAFSTQKYLYLPNGTLPEYVVWQAVISKNS